MFYNDSHIFVFDISENKVSFLLCRALKRCMVYETMVSGHLPLSGGPEL